MKKLFFVILGSVLLSANPVELLAQGAAVTNTHYALQEAKEYMANGNLEKAADKLMNARENIEKAITNEKTMTKAKTWNYRGDVYRQYLSLSEDLLDVKHLEAAEISLDSYDKCIELDLSKRGDYKTPAQNGKNQIYPLMFNLGNASINEKKYTTAMKAYDLVLRINPMDSNAALNAGLAAERAGDKDKAVAYYGKMIGEQKVKDYYPYIRLAEYYSSKEEYDQALSTLSKGIEVCTTKEGIKNLQTTEFNIYLKSGRLDEAISNLEKSIEADPQNDGNYSRLGQLLDQKGESDRALENYTKALELNPDNIDANYNMGAFYYNRGAEKLQSTRDMDLKTYQAKGKAIEKEGIEDLKKARPYFEKVDKMQPDDPAVLNSIKTIDSFLKNAGG